MTSEISTIEDLALQLTGQKEIQTNRHWDNTKEDWACPCCKRTKFHIARPTQHGVLKCALVDHHDHIANYADKRLKALIKTTNRTEATGREGWFKNQKVKPLIVRFSTTLICEDCNNADPAAKAMISGISPFFSFSPIEITYFIKPQVNAPHQIDANRVAEIYKSASENFEFQKSICDILLSRLVTNARQWGDEMQYPSSFHYPTAQKIRADETVSLEDLSKITEVGLVGTSLSKNDIIWNNRAT